MPVPSVARELAGLTTQAQTFDPRKWQTDGTSGGIQQFRNRAYDPATGTWIQEDPMGVAGGVNVYRFNNGNPVSFGDPFGLMACTTEELASWKETVTNEGGAVCVERRNRDVAQDAMQECRRASFFLGAGVAADVLAVGGLCRGVKAVGSAVALLRTNIALGARIGGVPAVILSANRARMAVGAADLATRHAASSAAVGAPLGVAADQSAGFGDVVTSVAKAFVPFSTLKDQAARTASACNPE